MLIVMSVWNKITSAVTKLSSLAVAAFNVNEIINGQRDNIQLYNYIRVINVSVKKW